MHNDRKVFRVTLASHDVEAFLGECRASEWYAIDTGERIMTDEGPDGEAILLVEPLGRASTRTATPIAQ